MPTTVLNSNYLKSGQVPSYAIAERKLKKQRKVYS